MISHKVISVIFIVTLFCTNPVLAHHVMGGELPVTFLDGFLSGLGHPIIGIDHLAFILGMGLVSSLHRNSYFLPVAFLTGTLCGIFLKLTLIEFHMIEFAVACSVILLGALVLRGKHLKMANIICIFAAAGTLHGYAYGDSIVGSELAPLTAYLMGLMVIQYVVSCLVIYFVSVSATNRYSNTAVRLMGVVMIGVGLTFMATNMPIPSFS